ncbi:MAG: MTH1187 family thiamine-binding protein [Gemmatales bacterium]|nr:MTH1187 family thiamine-binding protein [Gemmatales bacterium]MDW8386250.1 MTH1187 family thiamine-binding protein [Gemmatales bacterium]
MLAQFSIYPMQAEHLSKDIAKVIETLEASGLDYRLGPMSTAVEGEWDQVLTAIRRCHEAVAQNYDRVITTIVIDDRRHQPHHLAEMIASVEQRLGRQVKH